MYCTPTDRMSIGQRQAEEEEELRDRELINTFLVGMAQEL